MDEEYDVIVLGTGLTVSVQASYALGKTAQAFSVNSEMIDLARLGLLSCILARSERLLHPCVCL